MKYRLEKVSNYQKNDYELPMCILNKIDKYRRDDRRKQSLIGYNSVVEMLKEEKVNTIDFYFNQYGKPYLKNSEVYFNISHSDDYVISAISHKEIGIDIEKIRKVNNNTLNQFATEKEKDYVLSSKKNFEKRYFQIYCLKESYFKMLGTNLNNILEIEFLVEGDRVLCSDPKCDAYIVNILDDCVITYCERK